MERLSHNQFLAELGLGPRKLFLEAVPLSPRRHRTERASVLPPSDPPLNSSPPTALLLKGLRTRAMRIYGNCRPAPSRIRAASGEVMRRKLP